LPERKFLLGGELAVIVSPDPIARLGQQVLQEQPALGGDL